jgi:hypothetical protein
MHPRMKFHPSTESITSKYLVLDLHMFCSRRILPLMGSRPLRRLQYPESTSHPRACLTRSGPISGFLNLLPVLSLRIPLGLVSCRNTLGVHPSELFPHRGLIPFSRPMPLLMLNHQPLFHHGVAAFMRTQIPSANGEVFDGSHLQRFIPPAQALTLTDRALTLTCGHSNSHGLLTP